jgi:Yip1 domain
MLRRALALITSPAREWAAIAAAPPTSAGILFRYALPLAAIPAVAWEIGIAAFGLAAFDGELQPARLDRSPLIGAATTLLGSIVCVASLALALYAIVPVYEVRRSWARAWAVAAYGATPVWLAGALLVQPALILAVLVATLHACFLWFLGVQVLLQVPARAAAECVAVALLIGTVVTMLAGGLLGAAGML